MRRSSSVWLGTLAAALLAPAGCGLVPETRDVRVAIHDEEGEPIPGAVFYAEAFDDSGSYAFLHAVAGEAGEVPDSAREPLKMPWRKGARIALVAFAEGRKTAVVVDTVKAVPTDGVVLTLERTTEWYRWDPLLTRLAYPFEHQPELAARVAAPDARPLREAMWSAWESLLRGGGPPGPVEAAKLEAVRRARDGAIGEGS